MKLCDKIVLMDNGKIVEYGNYEDLINDKKSFFYSMYVNVYK